MGVIMLVTAVAPAVGPTLSGVILSALSWRWMFLIVLLALAVGAVFLTLDGEAQAIPLDWLSVVLSVLAFGGLVFGLSSIGDAVRGQSHLPPWLPTASGAVALGLFVVLQAALQPAGRALVDLRQLSSRSFTISLAW